LCARVQRQVSNDEKVGKLLDLLQRCGPNAFDGFVQALEVTDHPHAAKVLTDAVEQVEMST